MRVTAASTFEVDGIKVTLEWISPERNSSYSSSYYVEIHPSIPTVMYGNSSVLLELCYNILYNVSVLAEHLCEDNLTIFNKQFNYCELSLTKVMSQCYVMFEIMLIIFMQ